MNRKREVPRWSKATGQMVMVLFTEIENTKRKPSFERKNSWFLEYRDLLWG